MSTQQPRPIDRDTVERLLDGVGLGSYVGHDALACVLTAATAPARPGELAGERRSVAAFEAAHLAPATRPRRLSMIKSLATKILTVKAAAVLAGAAAATGGYALAATNGALPDPLTMNVPAASASASKGSAAGKKAKPSTGKSHSAGTKDSPSPSMVGLCRAYSAGNKAEHGKALESPAFTALIEAAGGKDKVGAFCDTVLASAAPDASKTHPNGQGNPDHPKGGPTDRPNGPTTKPSKHAGG